MTSRHETSTIIPREYLVRIIAQFMTETNTSISEIENALEANVLKTDYQHNSPLELAKVVKDVRDGQWDTAIEPLLNNVSDYSLASDAFELLIKALLSRGSAEAAKTLFTRVPLMSIVLAKNDPARHHALKRAIEQSLKPFASGEEEERMRIDLAARLDSYFKTKPDESTKQLPALNPHRLLHLIRDGLKWRRLSGIKTYEWNNEEEEEEISSKKHKLIDDASSTQANWSKPKAAAYKFGKGVSLLCASVSSDGETLAIGTSDGFVELLSTSTFKARTDLEYQKNEEPILVEDITSLTISLSGDLLACGDAKGSLHLFVIQTGTRSKHVLTGHVKGISAIAFSPDDGKVTTGGVDGICRSFGTTSGMRLCEFIGHESFINSVAYASPSRLLTGSSDEKCILWNATTGEQVRVFSGFRGKINRTIPLKLNCSGGPPCYLRFGEMTHALICSSSRISMITLDGSSGVTTMLSRSSPDLIDAAVLRSGKTAIGLSADSHVFHLDLLKASLIHTEKASGGSKFEPKSAVGLCPCPLGETQVISVWANAVAMYS